MALLLVAFRDLGSDEEKKEHDLIKPPEVIIM